MTEAGPILNYLAFFLVFGAIFAVMVLGLNLQWGFTGLFNVGVAGFLAAGAYTSAMLTGPPKPEGFGGFGVARQQARAGGAGAQQDRLSREPLLNGGGKATGMHQPEVIVGREIDQPRCGRGQAAQQPGRFADREAG